MAFLNLLPLLVLALSPAALADTGPTPPEDTDVVDPADTGGEAAETGDDPGFEDTGWAPRRRGFTAAELAGEHGGSACTEGLLDSALGSVVLMPALLAFGVRRRED